MAVGAVYRLLPMVGDPRFEGFASAQTSCRGKGRLLDDFIPDTDSFGWQPPLLAGVWKPLPVIGRVRPFNDYPCINLQIPAFSQRAVDALGEFLTANGELLPLKTDVGPYFAYNVTTVGDVLNVEGSDVVWLTEGERALTINRYAFHPERLEGRSIFRLAHEPMAVLVTDAFVQRAKNAQLKGLDLIKLWTDKGRAGSQSPAASAGRSRSKRKALKGNSLIVVLKLAGRSKTKAEERRVDALMDELDGLLAATDPNTPAVGALEGHDYAGGECRLFLSCPDADALAAKLRPWLERLDWKGAVEAVKRYGEYVDGDAPAEPVKFRRRK